VAEGVWTISRKVGVLKIANDSPGILQRAITLFDAGSYPEAEALCARIISNMAVRPDALHLLGLIELHTGRVPSGIERIRQSLLANPNQPMAYANLGGALLKLNREAEALENFERALRLNPDLIVALQNRGSALRGLGRLEEALASYDRAVILQPNFMTALRSRTSVLIEMCRYEDALASVDATLRLNPQDVDALETRGTILRHLRRYPEALVSVDRALSLRRDFVLLNNRGIMLAESGRWYEAIVSYEEALRAAPENLDVLTNLVDANVALGNERSEPERFAKAAGLLKRILAADPAREYALGLLSYVQRSMCDWVSDAASRTAIEQGVEAGRRADVPFTALGVLSSARAQLLCARSFVAHRYPPEAPLWRAEPYAHDRIRVAYVSADLRYHAVSFLMAGVLERHDRRRFETFGFSLRPEDHSEVGQRVKRAVEHFVDVSEQGDLQVARRLRALEIDIAVDLTGFTNGCRPRIFACRPAPVQVNYLGFPATMGAPYIDYILADRFLIPAPMREHYSEQVVYLPDCFQANESDKPVSPAPPSRASAALPADAIVLCCFNNSYKLTPQFFAVWCELLRNVPGSVLWLLGSGGLVEANLRQEARQRGVAPERLLFAGRVPYPQHLARLQLADLFLDTLPFGAGATASDALSAGLPLLTCVGDTFAGRMGGSLLNALGLPELIAHSIEEYAERALWLARNPTELAVLRSHLGKHRDSGRVFSEDRFCRQLERAYRLMWERYQAGGTPASFDVPAVP